MASIAFGVGTLVFSYLVQPRIYNREKLTTYECGSEPISDARIPFPVRYYIIAMLFVIFDIEIAFLYPWAVAFNRIGIFGFISMLLFIALFLIGYIYAWKKEGLEWD
ncbi:MAG: NADH-quinone oxidoreductase subunit A [Candidatus Manganitrophaceae bacterium]